MKLAGCGQITDDPISVLIQNAKYLLELDLTNCVSVIGSFLPDLATQTNTLLSRRMSIDSIMPAKSLPVLRELRLGGCVSLNTQLFISRFASQEWLSLRILDLTQCTRLVDSDLTTIITHASRIRNLVLYKCISLSDRNSFSCSPREVSTLPPSRPLYRNHRHVRNSIGKTLYSTALP